MNSDSSLDSWFDMARSGLSQGMNPDIVFGNISEALGKDGAARIRARIEREAGRIKNLKEPRTLSDDRVQDWYTGPMESHRFWPALKGYLLSQKGWKTEVVKSIDEASSKIVGMLQPPGMSGFQTRGLVLGHVQSGKTANFSAVTAKAADVEYKLFIILSGMHNALRAQTQRRLNQELRDLNPSRWISLTDTENDFGHTPVAGDALLTEDAHQRILAVVKKNSFILQRLKKWLKSTNKSILARCPILVIDDEADQASLNAAKYDDERTRINELIIEILDLLPRHAYVGYTATPFANVLVDPTAMEDLYPRDFIVDLPKPQAYFGPEKVFGRNPLEYDESDDPDDGRDMIRRVEDSEVPHLRPRRMADREGFEPALVPSVERAIRYFWLATAARRVRGQTDAHSSMLIHTSMLTKVHDAFEPLVSDFKGRTLSRLVARDEDDLERFRTIWEGEYHRVPEDPGHPRTMFDELRDDLAGVVSDTLVCIENNNSMSKLDYSDENRIRIVIGGNTLSRGLTLEGLVTSYFVRSAGAYDTLLQMGRWFGYRIGYSDLPRIWMTSELERYFQDLALVEAEIRRDIERYEAYGLTPNQLGVRIRMHPSLAVTSRLKMRAAKKVQHSYSGDRPQTILFEHRDQNILTRNLAVACRLVRNVRGRIGAPENVGSNLLFRNVDASEVLRFFRDFSFHPENQRLRSDLLVEYVEKQLDRGGLESWSVGIIGKRGSDGEGLDLGLAEPVPLIQRSRLDRPSEGYAYVGAIMSPGDQYLDLEDGQKRPERQGLLLLYPIHKASRPREGAKRRVPLEAADHIIGIAAVFPEVPPERDTPGYVSVDLPPIDPETIEEPEDLPEEEVDRKREADGRGH